MAEQERRVRIIEQVEHRRVAAPERVQIREAIQREECAHGNWDKRDYGWGGLDEECSNCGFWMKHYGYRCGMCRDMVCYTCRYHRF